MGKGDLSIGDGQMAAIIGITQERKGFRLQSYISQHTAGRAVYHDQPW